jgi:Flp pilus assembly protein TadG
VNKLIRDCVSSSLVEFTMVFPVFILVALGTVDVAYMLSDWTLANKAAYMGAHRAILVNPVATGITNLPYDPTKIGLLCFDPNNNGIPTGNCPRVQDSSSISPKPVVCTADPETGGTCTGDVSLMMTPLTATAPHLPRPSPFLTRCSRYSLAFSVRM